MTWDAWLIFLFLGVVVPWRGRARMQKLLAMEHVGTAQRVTLYATTIAFQWAIVGAVGWRAWVNRFTLAELGLASVGGQRIVFASAIGALLIGGFQWVNLRRLGRSPIRSRGRIQVVAERLLPQNLIERLPSLRSQRQRASVRNSCTGDTPWRS